MQQAGTAAPAAPADCTAKVEAAVKACQDKCNTDIQRLEVALVEAGILCKTQVGELQAKLNLTEMQLLACNNDKRVLEEQLAQCRTDLKACEDALAACEDEDDGDGDGDKSDKSGK